jgi:hypothetical protein
MRLTYPSVRGIQQLNRAIPHGSYETEGWWIIGGRRGKPQVVEYRTGLANDPFRCCSYGVGYGIRK